MIRTPLPPDLANDRVFDQISIGRGTYLGTTTFRIFTPNERIIIGRYGSIAEDVLILTSGNHRPELPSTWPFDNFIRNLPNPTRTYREADRPTTIGHDVWIGDRALIGGGVSVGHGAVVGAGAVVYRDVPPYAIVAGNPARILRMRFAACHVDALLDLRWWDWSPDTIRDRLEWFYMPIEDFLDRARGQAMAEGTVSAGAGPTA